MLKHERRLLVLGLLAVDVLAVALAVVAAERWAAPVRSPGRGSLPFLLAITIPTAIGLFALNRLYLLDELLEGPIEYGRIAYGCALTAFSLSMLGFWAKDLADSVPSRRFVVLLGALALFTVAVGRFSARRVVRALRRRGYLMSRAVIVGLGGPGISMAHHFQNLKHAGIQVVGFIDDFLSPGTPVTETLKVLGPPSAVSRILYETRASELIVLPTAMAWESFQDLIRTASNLNGHTIRLAPGFRDILATNVRVHQFGFVPLLTIERVRITGLDAIVKRVMDYGTAIVLTPLALPIVAFSAFALAATGLPPFKTIRVLGQGGRDFPAFLLNTSNAGNSVQQMIHRLGMHRLPHLFNVFRGEMSVVGPRPIPYDQRGQYERWIPNLLTVKPGMTGSWALYDAPKPLDDEMRMNLFYIRNYTIWLDLEIAVQSVLRLVTRPPVPSGPLQSSRGAEKPGSASPSRVVTKEP